MKVNLKELKELQNKTITIDGTYEGFVGTDLENDNFSVSIKNISRIDNINLSVAFQNEDGTINAGGYSFEKFKASISEVSGFYDENDEELSFDDTIKFLWENAPKELEEAISKAIDSFKIIEEEKKSETESLTEDTQNGAYTTETAV